MLDFHTVQIYKEGFVVESHHDLILSYPHLLYFGVECEIGDYLLAFLIRRTVLSSNIANRLGGVKGVSFSPTRPMRLLLLINSTN